MAGIPPVVPAPLPALPAIPENYATMSHAEMGTMLQQLMRAPPRLKAGRVTLLAALRVQQVAAAAAAAAAAGANNGNPLFHQYAANSMLAQTTAKYYGLADLGKLPPPIWHRALYMSPAAWPLLVQHRGYVRRDFTDSEVRLSPALQPFRLGLRACFSNIPEASVSDLTVLYTEIAVQYLALDQPTAAEINDLIYMYIGESVRKATEKINTAFADAENLPAPSRNVMKAWQGVSLQSMPVHMGSLATAMIKAAEKHSTAGEEGDAPMGKRRREELPVGAFRCQKCDGWFVDQPGQTPHRQTERHLRN